MHAACALRHRRRNRGPQDPIDVVAIDECDEAVHGRVRVLGWEQVYKRDRGIRQIPQSSARPRPCPQSMKTRRSPPMMRIQVAKSL